MKKFLVVFLSLILVIATATSTAFGLGNNFISNDQLDEIIETEYDDGSDFLKSNAKAPVYSDANGLNAVDEDFDTLWSVRDEGNFTQLTFDKPISINNIEIVESGSKVRKYHIDAWNGEEWIKIYNNDIIEGYYCAVIDTIKTSALRMYVDKGVGASIAEFDAIYQRPVEYDREFINISYLPSHEYFHDWFNSGNTKWTEEDVENSFSALTDLILLGTFSINAKGEFVISRQKYNHSETVVCTYPALSEEAEIMMTGDDMSVLPSISGVKDFPKGKKGALKWVDEFLGDASPRLWFCLTVLSNTSVGGISPSNFSAFNDKTVRDNFIDTVVTFAKKYNFDGVDIDWEFPKTDEAWNSYAALVSDLSDALHKEGIMISTAQNSPTTGFSAETFNKFDIINVMSYDQQGLAGATGHHSNYQVSTIKEIQELINRGVQPEKLVLGLAYYSSQGQMGWSSICEQMMAWEMDDPGSNFFQNYTFNNVNLIRDRTLYVIKRKLGGVMTWHICCDMPWSDKQHSLHRAQKETIDRFVNEVSNAE